MNRRVGIGGLINKNKFLNYFSALIVLPGGNNNSMQGMPLTFKAQINFVSRNWGYLSGVTRRCVAFYHPSSEVGTGLLKLFHHRQLLLFPFFLLLWCVFVTHVQDSNSSQLIMQSEPLPASLPADPTRKFNLLLAIFCYPLFPSCATTAFCQHMLTKSTWCAVSSE